MIHEEIAIVMEYNWTKVNGIVKLLQIDNQQVHQVMISIVIVFGLSEQRQIIHCTHPIGHKFKCNKQFKLHFIGEIVTHILESGIVDSAYNPL